MELTNLLQTLALPIVVAVLCHCSIPNHNDDYQNAPEGAMDEVGPDDAVELKRREKITHFLKDDRAITIEGDNFKVARAVSMGDKDTPAHLELTRGSECYSARFFPTSDDGSSKWAEYEIKMILKVNREEKLLEMYTVANIDGFVVVLTEFLGIDLANVNVWPSSKIDDHNLHRHIFDGLVDVLTLLEDRGIQHNNILPSSVSFLEKSNVVKLFNFKPRPEPTRVFRPWNLWANCIDATSIYSNGDSLSAGLTVLTVTLAGIDDDLIQKKVCRSRKPIDICVEKYRFFKNVEAVIYDNKKWEDPTFVSTVKILMCQGTRNYRIHFLF